MINKSKRKKLMATFLSVFMLSSLVVNGAVRDDGIITEGKGGSAAYSTRSVVAEPKLLFDKDKDKLVESLSAQMEAVKGDEKLPVIVVFNDDVRAMKSDNEVLKSLYTKERAASTLKFQNIPAMAMSLTKDEINALAQSDTVAHIEYDEKVYAFNDTSDYWFGTEKARQDFGLDGDLDGNVNNYSKDDVVVAVIDTGIDANHVDLDGGKVIGWKDFVANQSTPYDDNGHGTHVAGTIAGEGDGNPDYEGVAKGAALVGLKVLDGNGSGSNSNVALAVDWCITNKDTYGIDIINLSLGTDGSSNGTDAVSLACNKAMQNGITVVVAAGNAGPGKYTIGSPAAATDVITVGNMLDVGEDGFGLAFLSSRGPTADGRIKPDIAAPGTNITSPKTNTGNGYVTYSGTSMATPFTAGTIALMLEANNNLTPYQIKDILIETAEDWASQGQDVDYGHGRLDGYKAIKSAGNFTGTNVATPNHMYGSETLASTGSIDVWEFGVDSTTYPISLTFIITNWQKGYYYGGSPDFDLYLYDPSGNKIGSSTSTARQESIKFTPSTTGTYQIKAYSYSGSGDYFMDLSVEGSNLTLVQDQ